MGSKLFNIKPIQELLDEAADNKQGFKKALTATNLTTLGIGGIIGAGIFVLTGQAAAQYAGPAIVISFIISGIACAFAGLCYAEFASMIPISGSAYTYAYTTLGEFLAWIIGWDLILEYLFAASTVSVGWSGYMVSFLKDLGVTLPVQFTAASGTTLIDPPGPISWIPKTADIIEHLTKQGVDVASLPTTHAIMNVPAMFIIGILTLLLIIGIKESASFNNVMVITKVGVIILFVVIGFFFVKTVNWKPFIPPNTGEWGHFGWSGIFRAAGVIFFAYIGFDAVSTAAQEAKNPQKHMPIGILGSLGISTILYILVAIVLTGIVAYPRLLVPDPVAVGVDSMGDKMFWLRPIIKIAALAGLSSVILVMLLGQPRIFYTMAKDGLLPPVFSRVHKKFKTPYISSLMTGFVAIVLAGILPIGILGELVSIGTLLAFTIVCISIIFLRKTRPDIPRPFRTPFVPYIPILGALFCIGQMAALPVDTWLRLIIWMYIGFLIYFIYSIRKSVIGLRTGRDLYRTKNGALLAGVYAGYARLFTVNPMLVRFFALLFLLILPYTLLWVLYPQMIILRISVAASLTVIPYLMAWSVLKTKNA
ncbi:MAG: amino acid permease [Bacteroidetes bacterium]|nr:amino acid permease [Bacteroidota bacterium]